MFVHRTQPYSNPFKPMMSELKDKVGPSVLSPIFIHRHLIMITLILEHRECKQYLSTEVRSVVALIRFEVHEGKQLD